MRFRKNIFSRQVLKEFNSLYNRMLALIKKLKLKMGPIILDFLVLFMLQFLLRYTRFGKKYELELTIMIIVHCIFIMYRLLPR